MKQSYFTNTKISRLVNLNTNILNLYTQKLIQSDVHLPHINTCKTNSLMEYAFNGANLGSIKNKNFSKREYFYLYAGSCKNSGDLVLKKKIANLGLSLSSWNFIIKNIRSQRNKNFKKSFVSTTYGLELSSFYSKLRKMELLRYAVKNKTTKLRNILEDFHEVENGALDCFWLDLKNEVQMATYKSTYMNCLRLIASPAMYIYTLSLKKSLEKLNKNYRYYNKSKRFLKSIFSAVSLRVINFGPNSYKAFKRDVLGIRNKDIAYNEHSYNFPKISNTVEREYNPFLRYKPYSNTTKHALLTPNKDNLPYTWSNTTHSTGKYRLQSNFAAISQFPIILKNNSKKILNFPNKKLNKYNVFTSNKRSLYKYKKSTYNIYKINNLGLNFKHIKSPFFKKINTVLNYGEVKKDLISEKSGILAYTLSTELTDNFNIKQNFRYKSLFLKKKKKLKKKLATKNQNKVFKMWRTFLAITHYRDLKKRPFWLMRKFKKGKKVKKLTYKSFSALLYLFGVPMMKFLKYRPRYRYRLPSKRYLRLRSFHFKRNRYGMTDREFDRFCSFNFSLKKRNILKKITKKVLNQKKKLPKHWVSNRIVYLRFWYTRKAKGTFPKYYRSTQKYLRFKNPRLFMRLRRRVSNKKLSQIDYLKNLTFGPKSVRYSDNSLAVQSRTTKLNTLALNKTITLTKRQKIVKIICLRGRLFARGSFLSKNCRKSVKNLKNRVLSVDRTGSKKITKRKVSLKRIYKSLKKYCLFYTNYNYLNFFNFINISDSFRQVYRGYLSRLRYRRNNQAYFGIFKFSKSKNLIEEKTHIYNRSRSMIGALRSERKDQLKAVKKNLFYKKNRNFIINRLSRGTQVYRNFNMWKIKKLNNRKLRFLKKLPVKNISKYPNPVYHKYWGPKWLKFKGVMLRKTCSMFSTNGVASYIFLKKLTQFFYSDRFNKQFRGLRVHKPNNIPHGSYRSVMSRVYNLRRMLKTEVEAAKVDIKKLNLKYMYKKHLRHGIYKKTNYFDRIPNYRFSLRRFLQNGSRRMPQYWIRVKKKKYPLKNQKKEWVRAMGFWGTDERFYRENLTFLEGSFSQQTGMFYQSVFKTLRRFNVQRDMGLILRFNKGKHFICLSLINYIHKYKKSDYFYENRKFIKNRLFGMLSVSKNKKLWINFSKNKKLLKSAISHIGLMRRRTYKKDYIKSLNSMGVAMSSLSIVLGKFFAKLHSLNSYSPFTFNRYVHSLGNSKGHFYTKSVYGVFNKNLITFKKNSTLAMVSSIGKNLSQTYGTPLPSARLYIIKNGYGIFNKKTSIAITNTVYSKSAIFLAKTGSITSQSKMRVAHDNSILNILTQDGWLVDFKIKSTTKLRVKTSYIPKQIMYSEKFSYDKFLRILTMSGIGLSRPGTLLKIW